METAIFENLHKLWEIFWFSEANLNKIMVSLITYWKSLVNLNEIKKPSGKFLWIWAENQLRYEVFEENFEFPCENLNRKWILKRFFIQSSRTTVILKRSGKSSFFYSNIFRFGGDIAPLPAGAHIVYELFLAILLLFLASFSYVNQVACFYLYFRTNLFLALLFYFKYKCFYF